jgi:hypothetical protein
MFRGAILAALVFAVFASAGAQAKDVNLGGSGQGSWTTLPYVVAKERGTRPDGIVNDLLAVGNFA